MTGRSFADLEGVLAALVQGWLAVPATPHLTQLVLSLVGLSAVEAAHPTPEWWAATGRLRTDTWVPTDAESGLPLRVQRKLDEAHLVLVPGFGAREAFYLDALPVTFGTFHNAEVFINGESRLDHAAEPRRPAYNLCQRMVREICEHTGGKIPSVEEWWRAVLGVPNVFLKTMNSRPSDAPHHSELSDLASRVDSRGEVPSTRLGLLRVVLPDPAKGCVELAEGHLVENSQLNFSTRFRRLRLAYRVAATLRHRFNLRHTRAPSIRPRRPRLNLLQPRLPPSNSQLPATPIAVPLASRVARSVRDYFMVDIEGVELSGPQDLSALSETSVRRTEHVLERVLRQLPQVPRDKRGLSGPLLTHLHRHTPAERVTFDRSRRLPPLFPGAPVFQEHSHHGVLPLFEFVVKDFGYVVPVLTCTTKTREEYGAVVLQLLTVYPALLELELATKLLAAAETLGGEAPSPWYSARLASAHAAYAVKIADEQQSPDVASDAARAAAAASEPNVSVSATKVLELTESPDSFPLHDYWRLLHEARLISDLPVRLQQLEALLSRAGAIPSLSERLGEAHFALACTATEAGDLSTAERAVRTAFSLDHSHPGNSSLLAALDLLLLGVLFHRRGDSSRLPEAARVLAAFAESVVDTRNRRRNVGLRNDSWSQRDRLVKSSSTSMKPPELLEQMFEVLRTALPSTGDVLDSYDLEARRRIGDIRRLLAPDPKGSPLLPLFEIPDAASVRISTRARIYLRILTSARYLPRS